MEVSLRHLHQKGKESNHSQNPITITNDRKEIFEIDKNEGSKDESKQKSEFETTGYELIE